MHKLLFEELILLSKQEKKAKRIKFGPTKNVVLGQNDVGKSTLIKSLYHAMGADSPQLGNARWKKANPIYCLKFSIGGVSRYILRDERYFAIFDANARLLHQYKGITGPTGVANGVNPLLSFDIKLENKDGDLRRLGPAYYFLPFYVDQDEGWTNSWSSFTGLLAIKDYRKNMLDYHLGIRSQAYYDAKSATYDLQEEFSKIGREKAALITVRDSYRTKKASEKVDLNPTSFKTEVEELVAGYNSIYSEQQNLLQEIKAIRNTRSGYEQQIAVLEHAIRELEADYSYVEAPATPDVVDCPTCGTEFSNSIADRFGILDDIDYCRSLIDQKRKSVLETSEKLARLETEYSQFEKRLSSVELLLDKRRDDVTLRDIVRSEGYKDILQSISADITAADQCQAGIERRIEDLKPSLKVDAQLKKSINEFYQAKMKESLNKLNVFVLNEADYKTPDKVIKTNAMGSDLPRSLLAQYMSLLHAMNKFNSFTLCPLVIDSPLQQEQDKDNAKAIFEFVFNGALPEQQLILGTIPGTDIQAAIDADASITVIDLQTKYGLLQDADYKEIAGFVDPMHQAALAVIS